MMREGELVHGAVTSGACREKGEAAFGHPSSIPATAGLRLESGLNHTKLIIIIHYTIV